MKKILKWKNVWHVKEEINIIIQEFIGIDEKTKEELNIDVDNEIKIPAETIIGSASKVFGKKIFGNIEEDLINSVETIQKEYNINPKKDGRLNRLLDAFHTNITESLVETAKDNYGNEMSRSNQQGLIRKINTTADMFVKKQYGDYQIKSNRLENERSKEIEKAKSVGDTDAVIEINKVFDEKKKAVESNFIEKIQSEVKNVIEDAGKIIVETVETDKKEKQKNTLLDNVRAHLRGFSRTIPSFIMAYGSQDTTLENFDAIIPNEVFIDVTSISLEEFRKLRDGFDYTDENGQTNHYNGFFDSVVFNDSIKEFLSVKQRLSNYFEENVKEDIFDYIPPQKTNQIFTPKKVVKEMVNLLEKENPGCFDNPEHTFIDLYMKSGLYITEIVKRLYRSEKLKKLYPDNVKRLNHIFKNQVFGLAPTEIIYRIAISFILGFSNEIKIEHNNLKQFDTLPYVQDGTLESKLDEVFKK